MNTHTCIKPGCGKQYQDNDPDAYLCPECLDARRAIAREIDQKVGSTAGQKPQSDYQQYEQADKIRGFMHIKL